jgi:menaquinol-cytochrome c reductase iron-sulfur subunit
MHFVFNLFVTEKSMDRRRFHIVMTYAIWAIMGIATTVTGLIYLLFPPGKRKDDEWLEVTDLTTLQPGVPEEVLFARTRVDGWKVAVEKTKAWIVRKSDGKVTAFTPQCTHLGCAYHWDVKAENFLCPCHSSRFSIDGSVLSGPAPRPLDQYPVKITGGKVSLGVSGRPA